MQCAAWLGSWGRSGCRRPGCCASGPVASPAPTTARRKVGGGRRTSLHAARAERRGSVPRLDASLAGTPGEPRAHPAYPALRRLERLSYLGVTVMANVSNSEGRQALLEAPSLCARLRILLAALRQQRGMLGAIVALKQVSPDEDV